MLSSVSELAIRRPKLVGALAALVLVLAGVFGGPAIGLFQAQNPFADPQSASARAEAAVAAATGTEATPGVVAIVAAPPGSPAVASVARTIKGVNDVTTVTVPPAGSHSPLVSADGRQTGVVATLRAGPDPDTALKTISADFKGRHDVTLGGADVAGTQVGQQAFADLGFAELVAFPLLALLALLVLRGVAALLPLVVGGFAIMIALGILRLVNMTLPLSVFAVNLVIALGVGLAVDYSLFLVWRFREQLGRGAEPAAALRTTMITTGRTVVFSALSVAAALACLCVFSQRFEVSMGLGGAIVALVAAATAVLVLPALFMLLGTRLGKVRPAPADRGTWYRLSHQVMRHPIRFAVATTVIMLVLATPALGVRWSGIGASVLPNSQSAKVAQNEIDRSFPGLHGDSTDLVVATAGPTAGPALSAYADSLRSVRGVTSVPPPQDLGRDTWLINVTGPSNPISRAAGDTVTDLRARAAPAPVLIGGAAADFVDQQSSVASYLPLAIVLLALVTFAILFIMTGSVILPVKALIMNTLTVGAATGILVFVFQAGRLTGLLGYTNQGGIEENDFLILVAMAFALSTDYGVFLLSRIKEARATATSERNAVAVGLQHTGRLVTSASLLLAVAVGAFATSHLVFLQEVGVGTAVAVLLDAFVIRAFLVPSLMALLGPWNWWAPGPLRRLHERLRLDESDPAAPAAALPLPLPATTARVPGPRQPNRARPPGIPRQ